MTRPLGSENRIAPALRRRLSGLLMATALGLPVGAQGQGVQTASLTGAVVDGEGRPVAGAEVSAESPILLGARSTQTGEGGTYILRVLPPGDYVVHVELAGATPVECSLRLELGRVSRCDAVLSPEAARDEIEVVAASPTALTNLTVSEVFTANELEKLPVTRTLSEVAAFAPGVTGNAPNSPQQVTISGGFGYDNVFLVDGVDVNDNVYAFPNNLYVEDAIQEVQVITAAVSAEYGRFSGGVVNAVTKSGGDAHAGSLRVDFAKPNWRDETPIEERQGIQRSGDLSHYAQATLGGPLLRERLWYFLAGRDESSIAEGTYPVTGLPFATSTENRRFEIKLTGQLHPGHDVVASYANNDNAHLDRAVFSFSIDPRVEIDRTSPNELLAVSYSGLFAERVLGEARWSRKWFTLLGTGGWSTAIVDSPFLARGATPGVPANSHYNAPYFDNADPDTRDNEQLAASLSYFRSGKRFGSHDLRVGGEQFVATTIGGGSASATGYVFLVDPAVSGGNVVYDDQGRIVPNFVPGVSLLNEWIPSRGARLDAVTRSLYVNDRWTLGEQWSIQLGARYERVSTETTAAAPGSDMVDAESLVPRLGVTFDPRGDGTFRLDASWAEYSGRATERQFGRNTAVSNPDLVQRRYTGPPGQGLDFSPAFDLAHWGVVTAINDPAGNVFYDAEVGPPLVSELTFAAGAKLPRGGFARLTYVGRTYDRLVEDFFRIEDGTVDVSVGGVTRTVDRRVFESSGLPEREYRALLLQARANPTSRWTIDLGWTWQLANDGDFEGEAINAPALTSTLGDYPEILVPHRNEPRGRLNEFQEHLVRLVSTFALDLGRVGDFDLALLWRYDSPTTFSYVAAAVPLSAQQTARDPGYALRPTSQTLYFDERGEGTFHATSLLDLAATYTLTAWKRLEPWIRVEIRNLLNDKTLDTFSTAVTADLAGPRDADGLPTQYIPGPSFGKPTSAGDYANPREWSFAVGLRF